MSLRVRVILFILILSVTFCTTVYIFADKILISNYKSLENQSVNNNLIRADKVLEARTKEVENFTTDYAIWDDTYRFVKDKNDEYIKANLIDQTFENSKIDLMVILDQDANQVFAKAYDFQKHTPLVLPKGLEAHLNQNDKLISQKNQKEGTSGILVLSENILLVSSHPITTSDKKAKSNGTFIMATFLDDDEKNKLNTTANLNIEYIPYRNKQELSFIDDIKSFLQDHSYIKAVNEQEIVGYHLINDIYGEPQLLSKISSDRKIYNIGKQSLQYFFIALIAIVFLSCAAGILFLEKITLKPLKKLLNSVDEISSTGNFALRVEVDGAQDLTQLSKNINKMLSSLQKNDISLIEANKRLNDQTQIVEYEVNERTQELHQEQARFLSAIESISAGFLLTDNYGNVLVSNNKLKDILDLKDQKIQLSLVQEQFKGYFDLIKDIDACIKEKSTKVYENVSLNTQYLKIYIAPVFLGGSKEKVVGVVTVINDITEATILERSKEEFFSIASHELRTPLTAIKGNTEIIKSHFLSEIKDPSFEEIINDIYTASVRLIGIVNTFLTTSRLEQSRIKFNRTKFDSVILIEEVIKSLNSNIKIKGLDIKVENKTKKPIYISADRQRTEEVLINLLGNAIKFTDKGQIAILVEQKDQFVEISIEDSGKGIPEHEQNLLFKKFQQANSNIYTRDSSQGTGLGLYICKLMVEGMGGTIYLKESFVSRGSKFAFALPSA